MMWETLADLHIEHAEASIQQDRESIFKIIEDGPGFHSTNAALAKHLQRWVVMSCRNYRSVRADRQSCTAAHEISLCLRLSELQMDVGAIGDAIETLTEGMFFYEMRKTVISNEQAANLVTMLGKAKEQIGKTDEALDNYLEARRISEIAGTLLNAKGSQLLVNIAILYRKRGDVDKALTVLQEAQQIQESIGTAETLDAAHLFKNMGMVQVQRNELSEALRLYDKAMQIHEKTKTLTTPHGAGLLNAIGNLKTKQRNIEGALLAYSEARVIRERTATLLTPGGAALQKDTGKAKLLQGDIDGALKDYGEALKIRELTGTLESSGGAALLVEVAGMKLQRGQADEALQNYERARYIREQTNTLDADIDKVLQMGIAEAKSAIAHLDAMVAVAASARSMEEVFGDGSAFVLELQGLLGNDVPSRPRKTRPLSFSEEIAFAEDTDGITGWTCCSAVRRA